MSRMIIETPWGRITAPYRNMHAMAFCWNHVNQGHTYTVESDPDTRVWPDDEDPDRSEALLLAVQCACGESWSIDDPQPDTIRIDVGALPRPRWQ